MSRGPSNPLGGVPLWQLALVVALPLIVWKVPLWVWPFVYAGAYLLHVLIWPYAPCRRCRGKPKRTAAGKGSRAYRKCRGCGGSGERIRWKVFRAEI